MLTAAQNGHVSVVEILLERGADIHAAAQVSHSVILFNTHARAHTHTYTLTYTLTYTHTHKHKHTCTLTYALIVLWYSATL